jgi:hypothetical protein
LGGSISWTDLIGSKGWVQEGVEFSQPLQKVGSIFRFWLLEPLAFFEV